MEQPKKQFTPHTLRGILIFLFFVVLFGGSAVFYWGLNQVKDYAVTVNQKLADAEASDRQVDELRLLKEQIAQSDSLIAKANKLFATPTNYQSQVLSDVKRYGDAAGLSITRTSFDEGRAPLLTVTVASPTSFKSLVTFLHHVEGNLPKLQVTELSLKRADSTDPDAVEVDHIKIRVSVR